MEYFSDSAAKPDRLLGTAFSVVDGYGIYYILLGITGFFSAGWQGLVAYIVGRVIAGVANSIINHFNGKRMQKEAGAVVTMSELNFLNAYSFHARQHNKSLDLTVADEELEELNWKPVFVDLATKWPQVVARFTFD